MTLFCITAAMIIVMYRILKDKIKKDGSLTIEIPAIQRNPKVPE